MTVGNVVTYMLIVALAVSSGFLLDAPTNVTKKELLRALMTTAVQGRHSAIRVAIGYNANVDVIAEAVPLFAEVGLQAGAPAHDSKVVTTADELSAQFRYFFQDGAAGERTLRNAGLLGALVSKAQTMELPASNAAGNPYTPTKLAVGGNAALMAMQLHKLGCDVLLGGKFGPTLRDLLPNGIRLSEEEVSQDEHHLILEYNKGDTWGDTVADRHNRFILSDDVSNGQLLGLESLHKHVNDGSFKADVVVVAGLHLLESQDTEMQVERLGAVATQLAASREAVPKALFHVELASVASNAYMKLVADTVFGLVDSIGLNEQELFDLYQGVGGPVTCDDCADGADEAAGAVSRNDVASHSPKASAVSSAIRLIMARHPTLSRVHFHALGFHVLAERRGAGARRWGSARAAAAAASIAATLSACDATEPELHGNDLDMKSTVRLAVEDPVTGAPATEVVLSAESPVGEWVWPVDADNVDGDAVKFVFAPVLVCKEPKHTVGLGDTISATGLAVHVTKV